MNEEKNYILSLLGKGLRADGRNLEEFRKIKIETSISPKSAEGSARVIIGETEVVAGVKLDIGEPFPDTPDEGSLVVNAELLPLSSPDFELGPPDAESIELARVVDRGIRESKCLDMKKLCVKKGEKIWMVFVDIYPINNDGNLYDASALAAVAALLDAKLPKYDVKADKVVYDEKKGSIPIKGFPVACTIVKIGEDFIIDPTVEEEKGMDARLTVVSLDDETICALQKGGSGMLSLDDISKALSLGLKKAKELRKLFK